MAASSPLIFDIEDLGLDAGGHLLIQHGLKSLTAGDILIVTGNSVDFPIHLQAWCRAQGHGVRFENSGQRAYITCGSAHHGRWTGAAISDSPPAERQQRVADIASATWGLAARGATVEAGVPDFHFSLNAKTQVWAEEAAALYRLAVASQWNPETAVDWQADFDLPADVEEAVAQVMTFLIENENAALLIPARFLGRLHPHFREVVQLLAIQVADEARHVEVFTRRLHLKGHAPGFSTVGGQASLKTLFDEVDFSIASFLLSVLGEGTFVNLLHFLSAHAPDPITQRIARLAARDEARHVSFGMGHLHFRLQQEPQLRSRLAHAIEQRFDALAGTSGLNEQVFDALVLLAAGNWSIAAIRHGFAQVQSLKNDMAEGRRLRLLKLGFAATAAEHLANLHTRNFM